ncbi:MAG: 2-amino-4-hydroxy-6-hydroxymethyldihydropteridine diphosphokinase [Bacillota bacterium]|jgi:2-amino-4-hydroxy-6-hydroxymethyldihydropteridine diphosphokinase|nr:2-amino-4-hydroxy-6-hydroxymethyldihydropteridine diphosphokinase [Bacillota bacterium]
MTKYAYIGLGSNLGDRLNNIRGALDKISKRSDVYISSVSSIYETIPVGGPKQGLFLNGCAMLITTLSPTILLKVLLQIEDKMGRVRKERWGPRIIDIDLLVYEGIEMNTPLVSLPHPRIAERAFVVIPLNDIAPELKIPGLEKSVSSIAKGFNQEKGIKLLIPKGWYTI